MKSRKPLLLGLAAFLLALLIVLPASWVAAALPESVQCAAWSGSVWRGQCRDLALGNGDKVVMRLSTLRWRLRPAALLRMRLAAQFQSSWPQGETAGEVLLAPGGGIQVRDMSGRSQLDQRFFGAMPAGWQGHVDLRDVALDWRAGIIGRIGGTLLISDLVDRRGTALGSYRIAFTDSATPPFTGQLTDTGGPLELEAGLTLTADQSWTLEGRMRTRDRTNASLNNTLDMLSAADASGWRRLSLEGQFR